jgi:hypothetical protein
MVLDLDNLGSNHLRELDKLSIKIQEEYNSLTCSILEKGNNNIAWLFSNVVSRNNYQSDLFMNCLYLVFVKNEVEKNSQIDTIIVPNKRIKKILELKYRTLTVKKSQNKQLFLENFKRGTLRPLIDILNNIKMAIRMLTSKSSHRRKGIPNDKKLILIDTFMIKQSLDNRQFVDRYYTGILDFVDKQMRDRIYFLPTIHGNYNCRILDEIRINSNENILFKCDFINKSDYLKSMYLLTKLRLKKSDFIFYDFNVTKLIETEHQRNRFNSSAFEALLNFFSIRNINKEGVKVKTFINWFENQPIDKGLIKGFRFFSPRVKIIGYQGFIASMDYNFHLSPTEFEIQNGVIPDEIVVIGRKLLNGVQKFSSEINAVVGPAFRFIIPEKTIITNHSDSKCIMLVLPIGIKDSLQLIRTVLEGIQYLNEPNLVLNIKPHPSDEATIFKQLLAGYDSRKYKIITDNFSDSLKNIKLVLGSSTTTLMESVINAIPVLIIYNQYGLTQNPIPKDINGKIWKACFSKEDIAFQTNYYLNIPVKEKKEFVKIANQIRLDYFEKPTVSNVHEFLSI